MEVPLTDEVARAKTKYYLGTFVGYFVGIYVCLYLFSLTQYGQATASSLYASSHRSRAYMEHTRAAEDASGTKVLSDIHRRNALVQQEVNYTGGHGDTLSKTASSTDGVPKCDDTLPRTSHHPLGQPLSSTSDRYSPAFREYLSQRRCLLGCEAVLYPTGFSWQSPLLTIALPPGRFEDFLLYLCSHHPLLACFYSIEGHRLGPHGSRLLYVCKDVVTFVLYQFSGMLLAYESLDGYGIGTFINLFIITPTAVVVGLVLVYLYTCPFADTAAFKTTYAGYQAWLQLLGRIAILPLLVLMGGSLVLACLFSSGRRIPLILVNYFVYVQLYGMLLAVARAMLLFVDDYCYRVVILGVVVVSIGELYRERIVSEGLVEGRDYGARCGTRMFGTITVQTIVCRGEAVKRGWISTADTDESTGNVMHVIEEGQSHDEHHGQPGDDGRLSYREVYGTSEDKVAEFTVRSPMSMQGIEAQSALSGLRQALQITASTAGAEEVDPDEVLMAQYHQEVSNHQLRDD